jgi:hypothetical protein
MTMARPLACRRCTNSGKAGQLRSRNSTLPLANGQISTKRPRVRPREASSVSACSRCCGLTRIPMAVGGSACTPRKSQASSQYSTRLWRPARRGRPRRISQLRASVAWPSARRPARRASSAAEKA